jgi:aryl-alcohol dehydrogenase-like predicted oxidoreductase
VKYNRLGRTELEVSEICLGTMTWGNQNTETEAHEQIEYAYANGVNFMDTAEMYPIPPKAEYQGKTEEFIGNWFKKTGQRDKWVLASKVSGGGSFLREGTPTNRANIRLAIEGSLKRLQTDYIDLYQIHWPNRGTYHFDNFWTFEPHNQDKSAVLPNLLEILETLDALVREGKIRHIGLSNESAWGITQYLKLAEENDLPRVVTTQNEYSLLCRRFDHDLAEISHHEDVGLLTYSSLAAGVLSGKYLDGVVPKGSRSDISGGLWRNNSYAEPAVRCYVNLAKDHELDVNQMALAFALSRKFTTSVIIGATNMDQLKTDIGSADVHLSDEILNSINAIYRLYPTPL